MMGHAPLGLPQLDNGFACTGDPDPVEEPFSFRNSTNCNLTGIASPDYPYERLVVCRNALLADERRRKRQALRQSPKPFTESPRRLRCALATASSP
jgi:hypothetical protein